MSQPEDQYVVGVDFGTLSGRAVVVRVADGAELGTGVHDYPHGVLERGAARRRPTLAARLGAAGARGLPRGAAARGAGRGRRRRDRPRRRRRHRHRLHRLHDGADARRRHPAVRAAGVRRPPARLREAVEAPRRAAAGRPDQPAGRRARRAWLPRYGGLISSEWEFAKGLQLLEEDRELYDRMERWVEAADWIVWQLCGDYVRNACTAGYKGIYQDGALPVRGLPRGAAPGLRRLRRRQARPADRPARRRAPAG